MIKNKIFYLVAVFLITISCSKNLSIQNINKPFGKTKGFFYKSKKYQLEKWTFLKE